MIYSIVFNEKRKHLKKEIKNCKGTETSITKMKRQKNLKNF